MSVSAASATGHATPWPGLDSTPRAGISARIARRLFRSAVSRLDVTVHVAAHGSRPAEAIGRGGPLMIVRRPEEFFARLGRDHLIGFGEAYLTGAWDEGEGELADFLTVLASDLGTLVPRPLQRLRAAVTPRRPHNQRGSRRNTRSNVAHHYDLSNELFELFLDPTLSYSAALFEDAATATEADLVAAQHRKIDRLLDRAGVADGTRLLEIGTGWGELAIRAAARGAEVHTITLSSEQLQLARQRVAAAGYADRVEVELCDYRALLDAPAGGYDAVVSVEMIEAVGHHYWPTYLKTLDHVLAPGGRVALQAITLPHQRMLATRDTHTFITKYIFPGGSLPSVEAIEEITARDTGLRVIDRLSLGADYATTLKLWSERFGRSHEAVLDLGFDERFCRMWHFYLAYCRAGFAAGYLDDLQLTLAREA